MFEEIRKSIKENDVKGINVVTYYIAGVIGFSIGFVQSTYKTLTYWRKTLKIVKKIGKERLSKIAMPDYLAEKIAAEVEEELKKYMLEATTKNRFKDYEVEKLINNVINRNIY